MRVLLIKDGVVVNAIVVETLEAFAEAASSYCDQFDIIESPSVPGSPGIGWAFDGVSFAAPEEDE